MGFGYIIHLKRDFDNNLKLDTTPCNCKHVDCNMSAVLFLDNLYYLQKLYDTTKMTVTAEYFKIMSKVPCLMQPSMHTLNSPSSRVLKDV